MGMENVTCIRIFGSSARGDNDASSDLDVLAVYERPPSDAERKRALVKISAATGRNVDIAEYTSERIRQFFLNGDLFSWHLYQESEKIFSKEADLIDQLGWPARYVSGEEDVRSFRKLLNGIPTALVACPNNTVFECGLMYLASRNIAMSLSWYLNEKKIDFSRHAALNITQRMGRQFPIGKAKYDELIRCRHASQRGVIAPKISQSEMIAVAANLVDWARELNSLMFTQESEHSYANAI